MVTSNAIEDLFNMQATCKVFLSAARSDAVYKHATMSYKPLVRFVLHPDRPKKRFIYRCVEAGNVDAMVRHGLEECIRFCHRNKGMELLARASTEGSVEAGYLRCGLLMCDPDDDEDMRTGVKILQAFTIHGLIESFTDFMMDLGNGNKVLLKEMSSRI
ncbi:uncharacterized protein LOC107489192 [Arachis duranensis]|uniref:Uncharacterized protein LOC107489192 n=1 Tax=Arachis duranensis TaxID=130453 RepID=A0A6P4DJ14_ARADU|nr:uncharacterized protein LOC107489192 [Arachis duranensis]